MNHETGSPSDGEPEARDCDVLIVGAGPAGLTAAGDLARLGRSVIVLERWPTPNPASRAFATQPRTLELLDSRGLTDDLVAGGARMASIDLFGSVGLHFDALETRYPFGLVTPQTRVDAALAGYAADQGARIVRGLEVVDLHQDVAGVTVTAQPKGGGQRSTWRAKYVVGADGAHSTVRRLLGFEFPGKSVLTSVVLGDVRLANPPAGDGLVAGRSADTLAFLAPYGNGWYRSMTWDRRNQLPDSAAIAEGEIERVQSEAMPSDPGVIEISWKSRFHSDERQVADYRADRVFLAGDAAHVHSPIGGQGMNTGIQDAVNLAWKLDLALGGADDAVLDTYQAERHPIGRRVIRQSGTMLRALIAHPAPVATVVTAGAAAMLRVPRVQRAVSGSFTGISLRYRHDRGEHPLVGTRAEQVPLRGERLSVVQRDPGFVLIDGSGADQTASGVHRARRTDGGPALLVRPDGYIAWAGSTLEDTTHGRWHEVLARWRGHGG